MTTTTRKRLIRIETETGHHVAVYRDDDEGRFEARREVLTWTCQLWRRVSWRHAMAACDLIMRRELP